MGKHEGAVAIVTGASRGIGLGIAQRLVDEGARVVITARKEDALKAAVEELGGPDKAVYVAGNAADLAHQDEVIATAKETFGGLDHLVNNTGINPVYGSILDIELDAARKIMDTNVVAALSWVQKAMKAGIGSEAHPASVVNIASVAGLSSSGPIAMYGVSKAALIHLTLELGAQLGPELRVNAVAPAVVKTKFAEALYSGREEEVAAAYPMKRLGEPEDIASVVSFLLSTDSSWMTGQTLVVDGGITLTAGV